MERRQIGNSDLYVSMIGLGCMSLQPNERESEYIIDKALDMGVNYLDTADLYQFGQNEELISKVLKGRRADIIVATKGGNDWSQSGEGWTWNPSKKYLKEAVKASLRRLNTDYIDLYQLHGGTIEDDNNETIEAFEELKREGLIREYGISSIRPNVIKQYIEKSNIVSVMLQHNLLDRRAEEEVFQLLEDANVSSIVRGPVAKGLLTSTFLEKIGEDGYLDYTKEELIQLLPNLSQFAKVHNYQFHELALHYCLAQKSVASTIPGARTLEQLEHNLLSAEKSHLDETIVNELKKRTKANKYESHR
ncbi:MAG: aldo/keto reductase [Bacillaceae bacterium]|nr:aldo/keto reductase [Bacillaceae bacterium]